MKTQTSYLSARSGVRRPTEAELPSELVELIARLDRSPRLEPSAYDRLVRRHPKPEGGFFSKAEIIRGYRLLSPTTDLGAGEEFLDKVRMKPVRTLSGVAPVTVLTKPFPCPGRCVFCPSDVRMPKSYLSDEPGAQRAAQHQFDPFLQTLSRLTAYWNIGHPHEKVELIVLGGTWTSYPRAYQRWFVMRCFDAMNAFEASRAETVLTSHRPSVDYRRVEETVDGLTMNRTYNEVVHDFSDQFDTDRDAEEASWEALEAAQRRNETSAIRCVGLSLETRPDEVTPSEVLNLRRLGATKIQIGYQSLTDAVLAANQRGHDTRQAAQATQWLRLAGFKIQGHWMLNLLGSSPERDVEDFLRLFDDARFRPDELKIYPCSLIESAELMAYYERGEWRPYTQDELLFVLKECVASTPEYCRLTRIVRDIPGTDIVVGNDTTNFRECVEAELERERRPSRDIREREIGRQPARADQLELRVKRYDATSAEECFLQFCTTEDRLAGFLRLSLPHENGPAPELAGTAVIREVHVYGQMVELGAVGVGRAQHHGLGKRLVQHAARLASGAGFESLAVISSIGTREYYRSLGFRDGDLYQHLPLVTDPVSRQKRATATTTT